MPPKVKPDDFVDALLDSRVVDALAKALSPLINKTIQDAIATHIGPVNIKISEMQAEYTTLKKQVVAHATT